MRFEYIFLIFSIIFGFIFIALPAILWVVDILFRRLLEQRLFAPKWNIWGIAASLVFTALFFIFK